MITPFWNGVVDFPALRRQIQRQLTAGVDGLVACGTTGEASTMSYQERAAVIETTVQQADGIIPVIAGTGSNSTDIAVTLSHDAQSAGADALLVVTPYYNKTTQAGLLSHYFTIADAVDIPVIVYNVPSRTGLNILPETYAKLAEHPNIIGVKEASGNLDSIQRTRNLCPADFSIWSGNDDQVVPICALGGAGVISVASNIVPEVMVQLTRLCRENDYAAAGKLQLQLKPLIEALFCEVNPIPVKAAMNLLGLEAGELRLPLVEPSEAHLNQIRQALEEFRLL